MPKIAACPNCGGNNVYLHKAGIAGGGYAANYLPGLGGFLRCARLYPAVCRDCGQVRFFADEETCSKLDVASGWEKQ